MRLSSAHIHGPSLCLHAVFIQRRLPSRPEQRRPGGCPRGAPPGKPPPRRLALSPAAPRAPKRYRCHHTATRRLHRTLKNRGQEPLNRTPPCRCRHAEPRCRYPRPLPLRRVRGRHQLKGSDRAAASAAPDRWGIARVPPLGSAPSRAAETRWGGRQPRRAEGAALPGRGAQR